MHHLAMSFTRCLVLIAALVPGSPDPRGAEAACLADGSGRLDMIVTGSMEARLAWAGGMECRGMPRPDGQGLRVMFADDTDSLLVIIGIGGVGRGETGEGLPANFTLVKEGAGEFYSTLGDEVCRVTLSENVPVGGDDFRISGEGECPDPVPAVGREGEIRVRPFAFTGAATWPPPAGEP